MKKGQVAAEVAMLVSFMTLTFIVFFLVISNRYVDLAEQRKQAVVEDFASVIDTEITLALAAGHSYERHVDLPYRLSGMDYNISLRAFDPSFGVYHSEMILNVSGYQIVKLIPKNVTGKLGKGTLVIRNFNHTIVNLTNQTG